MKKLPILFLLIFCVFTLSPLTESGEKELILGWDKPSLGWVRYNDEGEITGYRGVNIWLGYSSRTYFEPGVEYYSLNPFWGWGTVAIITPYAEAGVDYIIPLKAGERHLNAGARIGIATIIPFLNIQVSYVW